MSRTTQLALPSAIRAGAVEPRRFRPRLTLGYYQDLVALVRDLPQGDLETSIGKIRACIDTAETRRSQLARITPAKDALQPIVYYLATLRLLRDLVMQGWRAGSDDDGIFILPPTLSSLGTDPADTKAEVRDSFRFVIADQLLSNSVSVFIAKVERQGVAALFADGPDLADRLSEATGRRRPGEAIKPFLQLVEGDARDEGTGIRLQDIWRYARLQWSIPYQQTPGRNLHYLIRDAAAPGNPIIGISALGNAVLGLSQRDSALGWSIESFEARFKAATKQERAILARHVTSVISSEIEAIYSDDFELAGLGLEASIRYLAEVERAADSGRKADLTAAESERTGEYLLTRDAHNLVSEHRAEEVDWIAVARTKLYVRKRAASLADLLRAQADFASVRLRSKPDAMLDLLDSEEGRRATEIALRRIKQRALAEHVMEIVTCGAVSPYNQLLGGKLVAMLMTSPQVVADVRQRYKGKVSLIASGMAGRAITRESALSLLTTSSLYAFGSAQYNRIRVPGKLVDGEGEVRYERVGTTESFGTVQFASDTTESLTQVARLANGNQRIVNNLFGEGMSPKLRSLRMGLDGLGLKPDEYLKHHSPRLLYAVPLALNSGDVLFGLAKRPRYILGGASGRTETTAKIANHWFERWGKPRAAREVTLPAIRTTRRDDHLLSRVASDLGASTFSYQTPGELRPKVPLQAFNSNGPISFVERLYRNVNSYADRLDLEELNSIHVDLGLDEYLLRAASEARQIVITGNPGDGKTFLIERLRQQLVEVNGAVVITDANALADTDILSAWRSCEANGRAFVLAINEWPLFELRRLAELEQFAPVSEAIRQVRQAIYFGKHPLSAQGRVAVVDLNLRNVLAPRIIHAATARLTDDRFIADLTAEDPALLNAKRLQTPRVGERLAALISQAARRGEHTTMRQLMGYLAFALTGGADAARRVMDQGDGRFLYANLLFESGAGPLFTLVARSLDPAKVTHPDLDEDLWRGTTDPSGWLDPMDLPVAPANCPEGDKERCFRVAKRRFFFEHERGAELLQLLPTDEQDFDRVLEQGLAGDPQLVRDMVLALNRFFEPDTPKEDDSRLRLWQSHRYDVRPPSAFVALYQQQADTLQAEPPQLADWVEAWLPEDMRRPVQFALAATTPDREVSRLLVDRELYLTLRDAAVGLGRSTWSRSVARKVTRFVDELHRHVHEAKPLADLEIRNVDTNLRAKIQVRRDPRRYEL